jgi:hypothetical protein
MTDCMVERQTDQLTDGQDDRQINKPRVGRRQIEGQTNRQMDMMTDRQTDKLAEGTNVIGLNRNQKQTCHC